MKIMKSLYFIILFFSLVVSGAPQQISTVSRVIDGDTIELSNGKTVRLIGINTPETKHPTKPVEYFGKEASAFTTKLLQGKQVRLEYDVQTTDQYGRTLAYVYLMDGTFVNQMLVEQGYAQVATYPPNVKYEHVFQQAQQEARANQRGLWANQAEKRAPPIIEDDNPVEIVYITATGQRYHQENCRYLTSSNQLIKLTDIGGYRLHPLFSMQTACAPTSPDNSILPATTDTPNDYCICDQNWFQVSSLLK